jgi:hypothetical protein
MYARLTGTPPAPNTIAFYYGTDDMFNNVNLKSSYRAKNIKTESGDSLIDDFAITEDERDAFTLFLNASMHDAFNIVMKMTGGVANALYLDVANGTILGTVSGTQFDCYGFKIKDHAAYNSNNLTLVDEGIKNLLEAFIMKEWYKMTGHDGELAKWLNEYLTIKRDLINRRLFQLRKALIN